LSCPYTSPQNGRTERLIRTTNDIVRTLLFQATLPPAFWVKALYTANHLLNLRPSRAIQHLTHTSSSTASNPPTITFAPSGVCVIPTPPPPPHTN
jgi:hypothetical protein